MSEIRTRMSQKGISEPEMSPAIPMSSVIPMIPLYSIKNLYKTVSGPAEDVEILKGVNLEVMEGTSLAILGSSGSGKSTLLHILGTLDSPSQGEIFFENTNLAELNAKEKAQIRNKKIGFVFQFHHLLPEFNTLENVAMQAIISGMPRKHAFSLAKEALDKVELGHRAEHRVTTLSGGERQRAAIARAILLKPRVLLADEPTGNLDNKTGDLVIDLLMNLNHNNNMTLIMVTHNKEIAMQMKHSFELRSGELYEQSIV